MLAACAQYRRTQAINHQGFGTAKTCHSLTKREIISMLAEVLIGRKRVAYHWVR